MSGFIGKETKNGLPNVDEKVVHAAVKAIQQQNGLPIFDPVVQADVKAILQQNGVSTGTQTDGTQTDGTARRVLSGFKDGITTAASTAYHTTVPLVNAVQDAMAKFGKIFGKVSLQSITFPMEGQMRRGPINFAQTVTIANTADPTKNPTEHNIFDKDVITPTYETNDFFPDSYDIAFEMGEIMDKTPELNKLNAGIDAQLKLLSKMIEYVNSEKDKLKK